MCATCPRTRATLFTLALTTHSPPRGHTGTHVTASPPASQRTANEPAALTAAHTTLTNTSGRGSGPPAAQPAHMHGAPPTHTLDQHTQPKDHPKTAQPNFTPTARTHNQSSQLSPAFQGSLHAATENTCTSTPLDTAPPQMPTTHCRLHHDPPPPNRPHQHRRAALAPLPLITMAPA